MTKHTPGCNSDLIRWLSELAAYDPDSYDLYARAAAALENANMVNVSLLNALDGCQKILASLIDPANKGSGIDNMCAWAACVAAEARARAAIAKAKGEEA